MRRRARRHAGTSAVVLATFLFISCVSSRVLHQSSGNTADQLVSDGSDSPPAQASLHSDHLPVMFEARGTGKSAG